MCSVSIFENFQRNKQNAEIYFKYQCLQYISDFGNDKLIKSLLVYKLMFNYTASRISIQKFE